jgi:hypothetical protein
MERALSFYRDQLIDGMTRSVMLEESGLLIEPLH